MELFPGQNIKECRQNWIMAMETSPMVKRMIRDQKEQVQRWDKMAHLFAQEKRPPENIKAEERIIRDLQEKGALSGTTKVLDIGAGLGDLTFSLARVAESVTALEPSPAMAGILEQRALEKGIINIHVENRSWQEVDLDNEGLLKGFDLVVASMNPGVSGPDDLAKMNLASRGFCYLSRFSGLRGLYGFDGIWELFFHEDPGMESWDIIYPFNMLYALGYRPSLDFIVKENPGRVRVKQAGQMILASLWDYMDISPEVEKKVDAFIMARADKGFATYDKGVCQSRMIWQVSGKTR